MTVAGIIPLVSSLLQQTAVSPADVVNLFGGILTVVLRVWFTSTPIG
jgi:hypothetical protein